MRYLLFLFGIPLLLSAEIVWQAEVPKPFEMTIKLSSQQIALDGFLDLEADFRYPSSYQLNVEDLLDQLTWSANPLAPQLTLYESSTSSLSAENGINGLRLRAVIIPMSPGPLDVSFLTVTFLPKVDSQQPPLRIITPVFNLQVLPLTSQATPRFSPLIPLEPQFPLDLTQANRQLLIDNPERLEEEKRRIRILLDKHTFPWLAVVALVGCGGIGWAAYLTRERWPKPRTKPIAAPTPQEQTEQALRALQESHLLEQNDIQSYYAELASILLAALQSRVGWNTKQLTTPELAQTLKEETILTEVQKNELLSCLEEIDQVKFANKKSTLEAAKEIYQQIQGFIQQLYGKNKRNARMINLFQGDCIIKID